jgi:hypothetical protein
MIGIGFLEPSLNFAEDIVAGENHALFLYDDSGLIGRMPGHVDHAKRMVTDVQRHFTIESDHRQVWFVIFQ